MKAGLVIMLGKLGPKIALSVGLTARPGNTPETNAI